MFNRYWVFVLLIFSTKVFGQLESEFTLVRENKSPAIKIYERWIMFPESNPPIKAREVKGDFFVKASIEEAMALLKDNKKIFDWQSHVSEFKVYPNTDSLTWNEYSYHDIPWPVSDQDHFLEYKIQERTPDKIFIIFKSKQNSTLAPEREHVTRMKLYGTWTFKKLSENRISVSYTILSMPSSIPRLFTDPVVRNNLESTIEAYIDVLEKRK